MSKQINIPIQRLGMFIPNKASLYRILVNNLGFYLPEETSKAITEAYLLSVLRGEVFTLKLSEVKTIPIKNDFSVTKTELIEEIKKKTQKNLGFTLSTSPDRNWLIDVLNTLDPENKLLKGDPLLQFTRQIPEE